MSKFVKVKTELRDLALIKQALDDLKLAIRKMRAIFTPGADLPAKYRWLSKINMSPLACARMKKIVTK